MNMLLAVGLGSEKNSASVIMEHMHGEDSEPLALVGKGVTFDTGGMLPNLAKVWET